MLNFQTAFIASRQNYTIFDQLLPLRCKITLFSDSFCRFVESCRIFGHFFSFVAKILYFRTALLLRDKSTQFSDNFCRLRTKFPNFRTVFVATWQTYPNFEQLFSLREKILIFSYFRTDLQLLGKSILFLVIHCRFQQKNSKKQIA